MEGVDGTRGVCGVAGSTIGGVLGRGGGGVVGNGEVGGSASNGGGVSGCGGIGGELIDMSDMFACSIAGGAGFAESALGDSPDPVMLLLVLLFSSSEADSGEMVTKF